MNTIAIEVRDLHIVNWSGRDAGKDIKFSVVTHLEAVHILVVIGTVARQLGVSAEKVRLCRAVGRLPDRTVFQVCDGSGNLNYPAEYADMEGNIYSQASVTNPRLADLNDTWHLLVPERRNVFVAYVEDL